MKYLFWLAILLSQAGYTQYIDFGHHQQYISIKDYKRLRDDGIVKQDLDFSCGAASLATLLTQYFNRPTTEAQMLMLMNNQTLKASFLDMQKALKTLGYQSMGLALSYDKLKTLNHPVIVYIKHRKTDHFSVIRGINEDFVWLADPSLGNRILTKAQFIDLWHTRADKTWAGKILVVLPQASQAVNKNYFRRDIKAPNRQSLPLVRPSHF